MNTPSKSSHKIFYFFRKYKDFFWPVYKHEFKKLSLLFITVFLLAFNYNILRCIKDALIVTTKGTGAATIPFIKFWVIFPLSLILTYFYVYVSKYFLKSTVFYFLFSFFLSFFLFFIFYLYPQRESLHLHGFAYTLENVLPKGFSGFIGMVRYWSFTLFYAMSELWGNIIISLLFWGFTNEIIQLDEAKRFYGILGIATNLASVVAGEFSNLIVWITNTYTALTTNAMECIWDIYLTRMIWCILISGCITVFFFFILNKSCQSSDISYTRKKHLEEKEAAACDMSAKKNTLNPSHYILYLAVIVLSYNVIITLTEVVWKQKVSEKFSEALSYSVFMNHTTAIVGVIATCATFFVPNNFLRFFGWTSTAMLTPIILAITSALFWFLCAKEAMPGYLYVGISPLSITIWASTIHNCSSRIAKYTLFDVTKEIAFIPLSTQEKTQAKAIVDGVCQRLGKLIGAIIYHLLFFLCVTIEASISHIFLAVYLFIAIWLFSVKRLGVHFDSRVQAISIEKDDINISHNTSSMH